MLTCKSAYKLSLGEAFEIRYLGNQILLNKQVDLINNPLIKIINIVFAYNVDSSYLQWRLVWVGVEVPPFQNFITEYDSTTYYLIFSSCCKVNGYLP